MTMVISFNGTDISTKNLYPTGVVSDWQGSPVTTRDVMSVAGRTLSYLSSIDAVAARSFTLPLAVNTNTLSARQTAADYLKGLLRQSVTVKMDDGTTARQITATLLSCPLATIKTTNNTAMNGSAVFLAGDPLWAETSASTVSAIGTTAKAVALGTAPTEDWSMTITVAAGSDPRTITVTIGGTVNYVMTWTGTIAANTLTINAANSSVLNAAVNAVSGWVGGFGTLDPSNGACTIKVQSSSGTGTGVLTYTKRYF